MGGDIEFLTPEGFRSIPLPTYPEIKLAIASPRAVAQRMEAARCDHVHVATEGPLGLAARRLCIVRGAPFTTSYHTRFPEYLHKRTRIPLSLSYAALRKFHNAGAALLRLEDLEAGAETQLTLPTTLW